MAEPDSLSVEEVQRRRAAAAPDSLSIEEVQERLRGPKFGEAPIGHVGADILSTALEGTGRRSLDSFFLGFGDEIIAGAQAAFGADYEEALAESEPRTQAFQEAARERSMFGVDPLDLAGLATGGGATFQIAKMLPGVRKLPGLARSAFGGGTVGGIVGAGQPGSLEERASNIPPAAALGAVAGPLAQGAARVAGAGVRGARDLAQRFTPGAQERRGFEGIARTIDRGGRTPQMMREDLERYGPQAIIADVGGPNARRAAQQSVELEGEGRELAEGVLRERNIQQGPRITAALRDAIDEGRDFHTVMDDLDKARKKAADPLYAKVRDQTIQPTDRMRSMVSRKSFQQGYKEARNLATEDGVTLPTLKQLRDGEADITGLETWDYIKRGMDEHVGNLGAAARKGKGRARYGAAKDTRRELLEDLDELYPPYKEARAAWAGPSRSRELLEDGRSIFDRRDPEEFIRDFNALDEGEKDFFRLGAVQEISRRVGSMAESRNALSAFWAQPNQQRKLSVLFPKGENMTRFMDRVIGEEEAILTAREVMGKSPTAERQALSDQAVIEGLPGFLRMARQIGRGDIGGLAESQAAALARNARVPPAQREAQAKVYFEPDRARQLEYLDRIEGAGPGPAGRAVGAATQAGAAGLGAGAAGRNEEARTIARMLLGGS